MSTKSPKILKGIRAAFLGFRWLFVLCLAGIVIQAFRVPESLTATVTLEPSAAPSGNSSPASSTPVRLEALKADVEVPVGVAADSELKNIARVATLPGMFAAALVGLILCEIVQRLIRNLEAGELFSDRNVALLRRFALILVAGVVVVRLLVGWGNMAFGKYAATHLTVAGARVVGAADHVSLAALRLNLGSADLLIGLLLLLTLWAFKEGAELKRDNELTV